MTIFSKPKDRGPVPPERCARCHARRGSSWLDVMVSPDAAPSEPVPRRAWLCEPCRAIVRGDAPRN